VLEHDRVSITADALSLPEFLEASIEGLEAGSHVTAADVVMPAGADLAADPELMVAVITVAPTAEQLEGVVEAPEAEAEGEEALAEAAATEEKTEAPAEQAEA
jgi:large subunit ribosomal protein L25